MTPATETQTAHPQNSAFQDATLSPVLWLGLPLGLFLLITIGEQFISADFSVQVVSEGGPYELLQFAIMVIGLGLALHILARMDHSRLWLNAYISVACLGCLYVAGEEISWGQHFTEWSTPEYWAGVNDQQETNFHNTSSWLDQKPRILLILAVYAGGLIIPLLQRRAPNVLPATFALIYPTKAFVVTALICLFVKLTDKFGEVTGLYLYWRGAETEELFIYYFVVLYLWLLTKRLID